MTTEDDAKIALLRETMEANVDFTTYETEVYLALVRGGTQTMTEIAETSDVPKQRVYDIVEDLQNRGFVEVIDDYPQKAYAVDPSEAFTSIRDRLSQAEEYLEELHDTIDTVESGVALFKSESTIQRYIDDLLQAAERDIFLLVPVGRLDAVADQLRECEETQVRLILSNVSVDSSDSDDITDAVPETVTELRTVSTREDFVLTIDRRRALYWVQDGHGYADTEGHGYYITNPSLTMVLDRFVSESIWPLAKESSGGTQRPTLPKEYMRIRDCLADIAMLTDTLPADSFHISFEGYDTETGEQVSKEGTLASYYYTEYDIRASVTLNVASATDEVESSLITVGGVGTRNVDYAAYNIELRQNGISHTDNLDDETRRHLETCRAELPTEFGTKSIVTCFDAFIDKIREFVERQPGEGYSRIRQFDQFRESLVRFEASEDAPRVEWRQTETEPGGHVAHVGGVFDELDYDVTLIGQLGNPIKSEFTREFRNQELVSLGSTTATDYIRFDDRKFLITEPNPETLDWERIMERIDAVELAERLDGSSILTIGTWFATPRLPEILDGLRTELWPLLNSPPSHVHIHPGDISHLTDQEIRDGCESFAALNESVPVTVTANRHQTRRFSDALLATDSDETSSTVEQVRDQVGVTRYVMHSQRGATLASPDGVVSARAPQVVNPRQIRNVVAHFISGLGLALAEGMSDGAALVLANSVGSYFMRHDKPPSGRELRSFVAEYDGFFTTE
ncbi:TrmB family transcriptional regulator [Haloarcula sp. Atlit-120R]|uniref:TrmB family transcriptional regulator n=1 Tax=Haloarcula sp. Atlit-120R TaxID=2282135 RepID=UPI001313EEC7|nr:TrmB family transcriptional regulator sugar-binding domain-containing protein [Haloarcula sp. Atlit-120R]